MSPQVAAALTQGVLTGLGLIFAALATVGLGLRAYKHQKRVDRQHELKQVKEKAYESLLQLMYFAVTSEDQQIKTSFNAQYFNLFTIASDDALRHVGDLWVYLRDTSFQPDGPPPKKIREEAEVHRLFVAMFRAIRRDCFEPTELTDQEIIDRFPLEV